MRVCERCELQRGGLHHVLTLTGVRLLCDRCIDELNGGMK